MLLGSTNLRQGSGKIPGRLESKSTEKRQSFLNSTVASRAAMNHALNCGVGIVLGVEDDGVVINEVIEGGPAQRSFFSFISR